MAPCATLGVLGKVSTSSTTTGIGSTLTAITGATIPVTVGAGRRIKISFCVQCQIQANASVGDIVGVRINKDGAGFKDDHMETSGTQSGTGFSGNGLFTRTFVTIDTPTAGSHTYALLASVSGAATPSMGVASGAVLIVEDVGT